MNIILDTNIIGKNFLMSSEEFEVLFDYLKKTSSKIVMPEVVYKEVLALYKRTVESRFKRLSGKLNSLNSILTTELISEPKFKKLKIKKITKEYNKYFDKKIGLSEYNKIIPLNKKHFNNVVDRAVNRIKPCSRGGRGFRDSLIWLSVLDVACKTKEKTIIFISNNTKDFASDDNRLHQQLEEEAKKRKVSIQYHDSIKEFIKNHAVKIDFITPDWINSVVEIEKINDEVSEYLDSYDTIEHAKVSLELWELLAGDAEISSCDLEIKRLYVYEKVDKSFYVSVEYEGLIEIGVGIKKEERTDYDDYMVEYSTKYIHLGARATYGITVKDRKVVETVLESADCCSL